MKQVLGGQTIYSVNSQSGTLLFRDNATTGEETDYISMGSFPIARVDEAGGVSFVHTDHLGSSAAASHGDVGTVIWRESYTPFGEIIDNPAANRDQPGFTGHIRDNATGLTYAQARYYNPVTARFIALDPVGFASGGPGYFNRYAYTMNDPVNLVDPTGEAPNQAGATDYTTVAAQIRNGGMGALAGNGSNNQRYFHTERYGWVDVRHFGTAANHVDAGIPGSVVKALGFSLEVAQLGNETVTGASYRSAFSGEDLPSNSAGVDFALFYRSYISENPSSDLADVFENWAEARGAENGGSNAYREALDALPASDPAYTGGNARNTNSNPNGGSIGLNSSTSASASNSAQHSQRSCKTGTRIGSSC